MHPSRVFFLICCAFVFGVLVRSFGAVTVVFLLAGLLLAGLAVMIGILRRQKMYCIAGLIVLAFGAGILRFQLVESSRPDLSDLFGKAVISEGIVVDTPVRTDKAQNLKVRFERMNESVITQKFFTQVTIRPYPVYRPGDRLRIAGKLEAPQNSTEFDTISYLAKDDIFAVSFFPQVEKIGIDERWKSRLDAFLFGVRENFGEHIGRALPEPYAAFLDGLLLGEKNNLPQGLVDDFRTTGTSHIIALSGYNIGIVGRSFRNLLLAFGVSFFPASWIAIGGILFFTVLTGASPSLVRAAIMGTLAMSAEISGRGYRIGNALAFAAAAMVCVNPFILRSDLSFQLSFLASLGLIFFAGPIELRFDTWGNRIAKKLGFLVPPLGLRVKNKKQGSAAKIAQVFKHTLIETLAAQILVLPLIVYTFGAVSLISPLANIVTLPMVPYAMGVGFLTVLLEYLFHPLALPVAFVTWAVLAYITHIIGFLATIPLAAIEVGKLAVVPALMVPVGGLVFVVRKKFLAGKNTI